ncbi:MAG: hypothetical protein IJT62_01835 [Oscillospiraceae bacterium]|nr:hypothetical protein [Oscillospiraceae bacterium]
MEIDYKILPQEHFLGTDAPDVLRRTAVIAHLYYEELFDNSAAYLRNIPREVDAYIVTANPALEALALQTIEREHWTNFQVISKPNRGRDYAALLVSCGEILPRYSYVCFVHDKKSQSGNVPELGELWQKCIFESMLASENYIRNVINAFESDPQLGVLSAPLSPEPYLLSVEGYLWMVNYAACAAFLKKLGLKKIPQESDNPLFVGSSFWFRTAALRKLMDLPLSYEDFPEEPMPVDGAFPHVLERSYGFIAEDAGYHCAYVLPSGYAQYFLSQKAKNLSNAMQVLRLAHLIAFSDNQVDFNRMLAVCRAMPSFDVSSRFGPHRYQRVFIFTEPGYEEAAEECRKRLEDDKVMVGGVNLSPVIDRATLLKPTNGFLLCTSEQGEAPFIEMMHRYGRDDYFRAYDLLGR